MRIQDSFLPNDIDLQFAEKPPYESGDSSSTGNVFTANRRILFGRTDRRIDKKTREFVLCDDDGAKYTVSLAEEHTVFENACYEAKEEIAAVGEEAFGIIYGSVICSPECGKLLSKLSSSCNLEEYIKGYKKLSQAKKQLLRTIAGHSAGKLNEKMAIRFAGIEQYCILYETKKAQFDPQTQNEIETLLAAAGGLNRRPNDLRRLNYILNMHNLPAEGQYRIEPAEQFQMLSKRVTSNRALLKRISQMDGGCILLCGPRGSGKEEVAQAVASIRGRPLIKVNLRGISSSNSLIGGSPGYIDEDAGIIFKGLYGVSTTHSVMLLQGAEGMSSSSVNGNVYETLAGILKGTLNDNFLQVPVDVSDTLFIVTTDCAQRIPYSLISAFEDNVFEMERLGREEKIFLLKRKLNEYFANNHDPFSERINFTEDAIATLLDEYTCDEGMNMAISELHLLINEALAAIRNNHKRAIITREFVRATLEAQIDEKQLIYAFLKQKENYSEEDRHFILSQIENINHQQGEKDELLRKWEEYFRKLNKRHYIGKDSLPKTKELFNALRKNHCCMDDLLMRLVEKYCCTQLASRKTSTRFLLYGGAGTGKTSLAVSFAQTLNRELIRIPLNGLYDSQYIRGGCADGGILLKKLSLAKKGVVILLDEIEKAAATIQDSLLDILDGNSCFIDNFYRVSLDLSDAVIIATANTIDDMSPWLLDRFEVIRMKNYSEAEKEIILSGPLLDKINHQYANAHITMSDDAKKLFLQHFENTSSIRAMEEKLGVLSERMICTYENCNFEIGANDVRQFMGVVDCYNGILSQVRQKSGYAQGLAVKENHGRILSVETTILPEGEETVTGMAQEDTRQCVELAHTYIRKNYPDFGNFGYHVHFGDESIRKSGPSAGIAIVMSMLSALSGKRIEDNIAFTGEISLLGEICEVGSAEEKLRAAIRVGCSSVYIPYDNYLKLSDTKLLKGKMKVIPCTCIEQVIEQVWPQMALKKNEKKG